MNRAKPEYFGRRDDYLSYLSSEPSSSSAVSKQIATGGPSVLGSTYQNLLPAEANESDRLIESFFCFLTLCVLMHIA